MAEEIDDKTRLIDDVAEEIIEEDGSKTVFEKKKIKEVPPLPLLTKICYGLGKFLSFLFVSLFLRF
jgi:hypothetical protein